MNVQPRARWPRRQAASRSGTAPRARLWTKDASLWTSSGEEKWLGWLGVIEAGRELGARTRPWPTASAGGHH